MKIQMWQIQLYCRNFSKPPHLPRYTANMYWTLCAPAIVPGTGDALPSLPGAGWDLPCAHRPVGSGPCPASKAVNPVSDIPTHSAAGKSAALSSTSTWLLTY